MLGAGILPQGIRKLFFSGNRPGSCHPPSERLTTKAQRHEVASKKTSSLHLTPLPPSLINNQFSGQVPDFGTPSSRNKSLFASFSSEKEDSCSFLKKRTKRLLLPDAGSKIRDLVSGGHGRQTAGLRGQGALTLNKYSHGTL
jgi:hypothetical protein